jgi:hypothetical protein
MYKREDVIGTEFDYIPKDWDGFNGSFRAFIADYHPIDGITIHAYDIDSMPRYIIDAWSTMPDRLGEVFCLNAADENSSPQYYKHFNGTTQERIAWVVNNIIDKGVLNVNVFYDEFCNHNHRVSGAMTECAFN